MNDNTASEEKASKAFGKRIFAGLIDLAIWLALLAVVTINFGTTTVVGESGVSINASLGDWPLCIFLLAQLAYCIVLEWRFGGTVGKLLTGIRVVNENGGPITPQQAMVRNVLRIVDAFPYMVPYLTGLIIVANDKYKQRAGDRAAKTQVVTKHDIASRVNLGTQQRPRPRPQENWIV